MDIFQILATFTSPESIGTTPQSILWLFPLAFAGCLVYKTIKLPELTPAGLIKEVMALLAFLTGLLLIIVFVLFAITEILT
jgi:hypothetical protein